MRFFLRPLILFCIIVLTFGNIYAQQGEQLHKEFDAKKKVRINTTSGDCIIQTGQPDKIIVDVEYSVTPKEAFQADFRESGNTLKIKERWSGHSSSGKVIWTLKVPSTTEVEFSTASGDLTLEDIENSVEANTASGDITVENSKGEFDFSTASGEISAENSQGEFDFSTASGDIDTRDLKGEIEFNTASGDIDVKDSKGVFELSCASGDIEASNILIDEESSFSTSSGDVKVKLAKSNEYDLDLSSSSGNVTLNYNGNPIKGFFEFSAKKRRGRIISPIDFDNEEEIERNGYTIQKKSFTKDGKTPRVLIETSSGKIVLKK